MDRTNPRHAEERDAIAHPEARTPLDFVAMTPEMAAA
jgi:hypothetical protein